MSDASQFYKDLNLERELRTKLTLPVLNTTAVELEKACCQADFDVDHISGLIGRDPALLASLLRIANSAYYGLRREIRTVSECVRVLGVEPIRRINLTFFTRALYPDDHPIAKKLWLNCAATSIAAQFICKRSGIADEELMGVAGVMHDIGKLVLLSNHGKKYEEHFREQDERAGCRLDQETASFDYSHTLLGGAVCRSWNITGPTCAVACFHHGCQAEVSLSVEDAVAISIIAWSNTLAHRAFDEPEGILPEIVTACLEAKDLGVTLREEMSTDLIDHIHKNVDDYV